MKKLILLILILSVIFISCSKEERISIQIDGDWKVTKFDGGPPPGGIQYHFNRTNIDGGGEFSVAYTGGGDGGKYYIKDETLTFKTNVSATSPPYTTTVVESEYTINDHSKKKLIITEKTLDLRIELERK